jgi:hypothetical protein
MPTNASFKYDALESTLFNIADYTASNLSRQYFTRKLFDTLFADPTFPFREIKVAGNVPEFLHPYASTLPENPAIGYTTSAGIHLSMYHLEDNGLALTPARARVISFTTFTSNSVFAVEAFEVVEDLGANQRAIITNNNIAFAPLYTSGTATTQAPSSYPRVGAWWNGNLFVIQGFAPGTFSAWGGFQMQLFNAKGTDSTTELTGYTSLGLVDRNNFHGMALSSLGGTTALAIPGGGNFASADSRWNVVMSSGGLSNSLLSNGAGNRVIASRYQLVASTQEYHVMSKTNDSAILIHGSLVGNQNTIININNIRHLVSGFMAQANARFLLPEPQE